MRLCGLGTFWVTVFATLLQHIARKKCLRADEIVPGGLQVKHNFAHFLRLPPHFEAVVFLYIKTSFIFADFMILFV